MTLKQAADRLNRSKLLAQGVLEEWPIDAGSFTDVEMAIEHLGAAVDNLDASIEAEEKGTHQ